MYLVKKLEPLVKSKVIVFVKTPLKLRKFIGLVLYWLAYGANANIIVNKFNVEVFIMHKYVDIIVDTLIYGNKFFNQYILYFIVCTYLGSQIGFFMHVAYPMFMPPLMGHIFHFPKSQISMLL
jgi:hypothetical protein